MVLLNVGFGVGGRFGSDDIDVNVNGGGVAAANPVCFRVRVRILKVVISPTRICSEGPTTPPVTFPASSSFFWAGDIFSSSSSVYQSSSSLSVLRCGWDGGLVEVIVVVIAKDEGGGDDNDDNGGGGGKAFT